MAAEQQQEAVMWNAICAAVMSGLKSIGSVLRAGLALPGKLVHSILGGGGGAVSDITGPPPVSLYGEAPPPEPETTGAEIAKMFADAYEANASLVRTWAASSLSAGYYQPLPEKLPRDVEKWLPGLRPSELLAIIGATPEEVSEHLRSQDVIPGVRSVRPLASIEWHDDTPQPLPADYGAPSFLNVAFEHETSRFQALRVAAGFRELAL
jgi:hypothetical protein